MTRLRQRLSRPTRGAAPVWPDKVVAQYKLDILGTLRVVQDAIRDEVVQRGEAWTNEVNAGRRRRSDAVPDELREALRRIRIRTEGVLNDQALEHLAAIRGVELEAHNREDFRRRVKRIAAIDIVASSPRLQSIVPVWVDENASLIKTLAESEIDDVGKLVRRAWQSGQHWQATNEQIVDRFGNSDWFAERIARDQTAKLVRDLDTDRMQAVGVESFIWRNMRDGRVRERHRSGPRGVANRVYPVGVGHATEGLPGTRVLCRCYQEPVFFDPVTGEPQTAFGDPLDVRGELRRGLEAEQGLARERLTKSIRAGHRERQNALIAQLEASGVKLTFRQRERLRRS